jgi:hypothetical protein
VLVLVWVQLKPLLSLMPLLWCVKHSYFWFWLLLVFLLVFPLVVLLLLVAVVYPSTLTALLPLSLLVSAAFAAFSRLVNGCGARFSGIGAGSSFGAEFAFKSRAAFSWALSLSPLALKNLPLTGTPDGFSAFLILPLPDCGGGPPPGGGAIPAGTSGGPGMMCKTNSFFAP